MIAYTEQQLRDANVNPSTGLATDYLNLFNEAIMLFEMGIDMPDMAEELVDWQRRDYVAHFEKSGFEQKDIVIEAYRSASPEVRVAFDECCEKALDSFESSIQILLSSLEKPVAHEELETRLAQMKELVTELDSHIHGRVKATDSDAQSAVDALF